ncbi:MAG: DUF6884 domain-containing protein [Armatimonadota bacterium]|jgi:hypothetical protein
MADREMHARCKKKRTVYLVSCVKRKRSECALARDLYDESDWFCKTRCLVEATGCPWFILSAKYGLVAPDQKICPYDQTLVTMSVAERRCWANMVMRQMDEHLPPADCIVVLAGQRYREFLMDYLKRKAPCVRVPMKGLRQGEQLRWLDRNRGHEPRC